MSDTTENLEHKYPQFILDREAVVTRKISDTARYIGYGYLIAAFTIFSSTSPFATSLIETHKNWIVSGAVFALLVILFDYLQYVVGSIVVRYAKKENKATGGGFDENSLVYKSQIWLFRLKQLFCLLAALILVLVMLSVTSI